MDKSFCEILNKINPEILKDSSKNLIDDEILDSLMIVQLVSMIESFYSIKIAPTDIVRENFETVDAIWYMVTKYRNKS